MIGEAMQFRRFADPNRPLHNDPFLRERSLQAGDNPDQPLFLSDQVAALSHASPERMRQTRRFLPALFHGQMVYSGQLYRQSFPVGIRLALMASFHALKFPASEAGGNKIPTMWQCLLPG
jgi:hypothetical protein